MTNCTNLSNVALCCVCVCVCCVFKVRDDQENQDCTAEMRWTKRLRASEGDQTMEAINDTVSLNLLISLLPLTVSSYVFIAAWVEDNTVIISVS